MAVTIIPIMSLNLLLQRIILLTANGGPMLHVLLVFPLLDVLFPLLTVYWHFYHTY